MVPLGKSKILFEVTETISKKKLKFGFESSKNFSTDFAFFKPLKIRLSIT